MIHSRQPANALAKLANALRDAYHPSEAEADTRRGHDTACGLDKVDGNGGVQRQRPWWVRRAFAVDVQEHDRELAEHAAADATDADNGPKVAAAERPLAGRRR